MREVAKKIRVTLIRKKERRRENNKLE